MPSFATLILYSTSHCHLCEEAIALLNTHPSIQFTAIEISNDQQLLAQYGTRIPVLQRVDNQAELNWPFNADDVRLLASIM